MMTIIADTNVASEIVGPRPHPAVRAWWRRQVVLEMFTTAVTEAEIRYGLAIMPTGRRHDELVLQAEYLLGGYFEDRILPFDSAAAQIYADIRSHRREIGRPIKHPDAKIAAIARVHNAIVATRNVSDFTDCGVELVNPWSTEGATR